VKYTYKPIEQAQVGDIVEAKNAYRDIKPGELRQIVEVPKEGIYVNSVNAVIQDFEYVTNGWKLIETLPGEEAKVGDTVVKTTIRSHHAYEKHVIGTLEQVKCIHTNGVTISSNNGFINFKDFRVICQETVTTNPFKVGDVIRRIANGSNLCPIDSEHTVCKVVGKTVYYTDTFTSHYENWELVKSADQNSLLPRQTKEYFDAFQIVYKTGVRLVYTCLQKPSWVPLVKCTSPATISKQLRRIQLSKTFIPVYKQADLPEGCPDDQFSDEYWEFWEELNKTHTLEYFAYGTTEWTPVDIIKDLKQVYYLKDNRPRLFKIKVNDTKNGEFSESQELKKQTQTIKERTMQEKVTVEIDASILRQVEPQPEAPKTALEKATSAVLIIYNQNGNIFDMKTEATATDIKSAKADLQKPGYLGFTIRIYKFNKGFTTSIPVVETKG